jgi:hypothetical protein
MQNSLKKIRPKANTLLDLPTFLEFFDVKKNKTLASSLLELMDTPDLPKPLQNFFQLPKFRALIEALHEGSIEPNELSSKEIHTLQLLLESFHKLVHLNFEYEEIEHPVVQAKVLEQNIHDYIACIELFTPYESNIVTEILTELFSNLHFFLDKFKATILENSSYFSKKLISLMNSEIIHLISTLNRKNFPHFSYLDWYPISLELNIDAKLVEKNRELTFLAKSNAHKILNQIQTHLGDISRIHLKNPKEDAFEDVKKYIDESFQTQPEGLKLTGQEVNELFYEEFWKEKYALLLTKEKILLSKLAPLSKEVYSLAMSLNLLNQNYFYALPNHFTSYLFKNLNSFEFMTNHLSSPNLIFAEFSNGFFTSQIEYLDESLSSNPILSIPKDALENLNSSLVSLVSFIKTYYNAKPIASFQEIKESFENLFSLDAAYTPFSKEEILEKIEKASLKFYPIEKPPLDLLEAIHNKIVNQLKNALSYLEPNTTCYSIFEEKISIFDKIDLPSYSQTWHTIGQLLGAIFVLIDKQESKDFSEALNQLKILFPTFFSAKK